MPDLIFTHFNYGVVIVLMMVGLYTIFATQNLIKKLVGLSVFQTSVFLLYITISKVEGGQPPIIVKTYGGGDSEVLYSNPLPHVLILTAIVVGVATLAIGLALVVRIREVYGTIEKGEIDALDYSFNLEGTDG
jgi:multicomponent Na+:H+ antiporter subunit C